MENRNMKQIIYALILVAAGCGDVRSDPMSLMNEIIVFNYQKGAFPEQRKAKIQFYLESVDAANIGYSDLGGAHVNAICLLLKESMDKLKGDAVSYAHYKSIREKLEVSINSTKYSYTLFQDCRGLYDMEAISPRVSG
ncbi:hypothetical protein [Rheinheimera sp. NSM]|uniref:hypothetical protein n=1 Tax=Rheinheimera sp. NSM TaxID=3457884 RepID=UPI0040374E50